MSGFRFGIPSSDYFKHTCGECHYWRALRNQSPVVNAPKIGDCSFNPPTMTLIPVNAQGQMAPAPLFPKVPQNHPACSQFAPGVTSSTNPADTSGGDSPEGGVHKGTN